MKWSDKAWGEIEGIYASILNLPFVKELAEGTLQEDKFMFYLMQDALYLDGYSANLAHIASRIRRKDQMESFLRFALDGIEVERQMHGLFLKDVDMSEVEMTPTCMLYTTLLRAQGLAPVEVEAAAVLPCFWIYQRVGEYILSVTDLAENPYARWISTYADPTFAESTRRAVEICDQMAETASEEVRRSMSSIFVKCARMEWMFWDSAYNKEQWKI